MGTFAGGRQQDAEELFHHLIAILQGPEKKVLQPLPKPSLRPLDMSSSCPHLACNRIFRIIKAESSSLGLLRETLLRNEMRLVLPLATKMKKKRMLFL